MRGGRKRSAGRRSGPAGRSPGPGTSSRLKVQGCAENEPGPSGSLGGPGKARNSTDRERTVLEEIPGKRALRRTLSPGAPGPLWEYPPFFVDVWNRPRRCAPTMTMTSVAILPLVGTAGTGEEELGHRIKAEDAVGQLLRKGMSGKRKRQEGEMTNYSTSQESRTSLSELRIRVAVAARIEGTAFGMYHRPARPLALLAGHQIGTTGVSRANVLDLVSTTH